MGRKSQAKHNGKKTPDKDKIRRARELLVLSERILRLTSVIPGVETGGVSPWERHEALMRLLADVAAAERSDGGNRKSGSRHRSDGLEAFKAWLAENGAEFDGVEIAEFPGVEMGLKALKDFAEGSPVLTVPRRLMMSEEEAKKSDLAPFIESDPLLQNMPNVALALFLLIEKYNPDSFWKPYLDILPDSYTTVLYFTTEELQEMKPSPVLEQSLKLCQSIARQYAYLYSKIHMGVSGTHALRDIFTYERYRWAVSTVMTRQNSLAGSAAFIPLWDMCNHQHGKISTDYNPELGRSECYALRDFTAGEQILIFYGVRSNADLFLHNGFVYPENRQDSVTVPLGISSSDPQREKRLTLLSRPGLAGVTHFTLNNGDNPISPELLAFVRVFSMNDEELDKWLSSGQFGDLVSSEGESAAAVGAVVDRKAYSYLRTRCGLIAAAYRKDAPAAAGGAEASAHRKNIKLLKECELKVLEHAIEHTKKVLEQLPTDGVAA